MSAEGLREKATQAIEENREKLVKLSRSIFEEPELMFNEHKTVEKLLEALKVIDGLHIEKGVANLETAFIASLGGSKEGPVIAILSEYDALPEIGHGCGHNLICASTVGAMLGLAPVIGELDGKVELIGTPAEEGGGGKIIMHQCGVFEHVDAVYSIHPQRFNNVGAGMLGAKQVRFKFTGKSSHASYPSLGRSALEAVIQTFVNVNSMRQFITEDTRIHGIIEDGGIRPNIIPDSGSCLFYVRAIDEKYLENLKKRVELCARAAAISTETKVQILSVEGAPNYRPLMCNQTLSQVMRGILEDLGVREFEDVRYMSGSNDMGNLSHEKPASRAWLKICKRDVAAHSLEFGQATLSGRGQEAMILAAKLQALTAIELLENPRLLKEIKEEFQKSLK